MSDTRFPGRPGTTARLPQRLDRGWPRSEIALDIDGDPYWPTDVSSDQPVRRLRALSALRL